MYKKVYSRINLLVQRLVAPSFRILDDFLDTIGQLMNLQDYLDLVHPTMIEWMLKSQQRHMLATIDSKKEIHRIIQKIIIIMLTASFFF